MPGEVLELYSEPIEDDQAIIPNVEMIEIHVRD